ncbi:hypothetical protein ISU07_13895 [Nocardioides islandensis]|uniref:Uncharacterized protein n=1 Tax=Nocardioides islandensis TaxID=433663 RepID=A0A930VCV5_9ACTN|nr:hypothetical protein [Nocardioides islandensis]MBF4764222.1 hypothetical protein [Nocardioides islandensis]
MKPEYVVYVLTFLAAVVVALTRIRLMKDSAAGRHQVGLGILNVHTFCGVLALVGWVVYLVGASDLVGVVALAFWWLTALAGLLILLRWLPSRGKHATGARDDTWSEGPGLSILGHVGMFVGVLVFTWFYVSR